VTCYIEIHTDDPIILSAYAVDLERRMLARVLYVVGKSDMPG
jgi:hypothetical protein